MVIQSLALGEKGRGIRQTFLLIELPRSELRGIIYPYENSSNVVTPERFKRGSRSGRAWIPA